MKNLAGVKEADETILEELYLAGIPAIKVDKSTGEVNFSYVGKIGNWTFSRRWYYWAARVEDVANGLSVEVALELNNRKHPTNGEQLGDTIRAGGHAGGISPDGYVGQPIYNEELNSQLESLGYKKEYNDFFKKEYISINAGEIAKLCNEGKLTVKRYIDCYHIDEQIGLNEFVKTILPESTPLSDQGDVWTRVEDGLPDESMGRVLCWCEEINDLGKSYFFWNCSYSKLHGVFTDQMQTYHVTHWKKVTPPQTI